MKKSLVVFWGLLTLVSLQTNADELIQVFEWRGTVPSSPTTLFENVSLQQVNAMNSATNLLSSNKRKDIFIIEMYANHKKQTSALIAPRL